MNKEELLRRLEERLARGEISEGTYLGIKARYDAMPELPPVPEAPSPPEPPTPPEPPMSPEAPRHAQHAGHPFREGDLERMIEDSIEGAMQQVATGLEAAFSNKEEVRLRMDQVNRRVQEAMSKIGPRIEEGGRTCVIRGSGTVAGGQHFEEFKCAGSGVVTGDLLADEAHISGACVIQGRCEGKEFHASGRAEIAKDVQVQEFHVSGKASVGGDIRAQEVHISGSAKIGGGIEAEDIDIRLAGTSKTTSIKGEDIEIRRGERRGELIVDSIEGEQVYVEATHAGLVRGESVRLGPYSSVQTVEADELEVHETATFKERRPRAHG